jgi:hypothetical protein
LLKNWILQKGGKSTLYIFFRWIISTLIILILTIPNPGLIWAKSKIEAVPLSEAIAKKWVKAQLTGINEAPQVGRQAGESIMLRVQNVSQRPLELIIPRGTVLQTEVRGVTDMVVNRVVGIPKGLKEIIPTSQIILEDSEPKEYILEAYSLDFGQDPPTFSDPFTLDGPVHPSIQKLLETLPQLPAEKRSTEAVQVAIWKLTNPESEPDFRKVGFPVKQEDVSNAQFILAAAGLEKVRVEGYKKNVVVEGFIYCLLPTANNELTMEPGSCPGGDHLHVLRTQDGKVITLQTSKEMTDQIAKLSQKEKAHAVVTGKSVGRLIIDPESVTGVEDH